VLWGRRDCDSLWVCMGVLYIGLALRTISVCYAGAEGLLWFGPRGGGGSSVPGSFEGVPSGGYILGQWGVCCWLACV